MTTKYDVLVIGAGAAGLMAMHELTNAGYSVCLLEATGSAGGRIAPIIQPGNEQSLEAGAEFIHGKAPITLELLERAGIAYVPVTGKMITVRNGVWFDEGDGDEYFGSVMEQMEKVEGDCTVLEFLDQYLPPGEHDAGRAIVEQMAQGFSLMDIHKASFRAFYKDLMSLDEPQYRIQGGYGVLLDHLLKSCDQENAVLHFFSPVVRIAYSKGNVTAYTADGKEYEAAHVIITASAGMLQGGHIIIDPLPAAYEQAIQQLGFGSVLKILFRFREPFWQDRNKDIGFLLSNEDIPTWWTQLPDEHPLLTGWVGGPPAGLLNKLSGDELYELALTSLSNIFGMSADRLSQLLLHHNITCWDERAYTKGGYSYNTLQSAPAKAILNQPVEDTLYFAGEALYSGDFQGTVEAALSSGRDVAAKIIKRDKF